MNAALQCLAHVPPMRSYFALGEYEFDIYLHELTTLILDVEVASECNSQSQGNLWPIAWTEDKPMSATSNGEFEVRQ